MLVQKNSKKRTVKASSRAAKARARRAIRANEEFEEEEIEEGRDVDIDPEAADLLFEAEDVAELIMEVTGQDVAVTVDDDEVKFEVGEDEFTVTAEGDEEILESTRRPLKNKKTVKASRNAKRPAKRRARR